MIITRGGSLWVCGGFGADPRQPKALPFKMMRGDAEGCRGYFYSFTGARMRAHTHTRACVSAIPNDPRQPSADAATTTASGAICAACACTGSASAALISSAHPQQNLSTSWVVAPAVVCGDRGHVAGCVCAGAARAVVRRDRRGGTAVRSVGARAWERRGASRGLCVAVARGVRTSGGRPGARLERGRRQKHRLCDQPAPASNIIAMNVSATQRPRARALPQRLRQHNTWTPGGAHCVTREKSLTAKSLFGGSFLGHSLAGGRDPSISLLTAPKKGEHPGER